MSSCADVSEFAVVLFRSAVIMLGVPRNWGLGADDMACDADRIDHLTSNLFCSWSVTRPSALAVAT
jgi:hypothetical protein